MANWRRNREHRRSDDYEREKKRQVPVHHAGLLAANAEESKTKSAWFAAVPPDVRKGWAFPGGCDESLGLRPKVGGRSPELFEAMRPAGIATTAHRTAKP